MELTGGNFERSDACGIITLHEPRGAGAEARDAASGTAELAGQPAAIDDNRAGHRPMVSYEYSESAS